MAKSRYISPNFWTDSKVVDDFTPEDRYIYLYCMTNPHTNLCGCYEVSIKDIAHETGYNEDTVKRLLIRLDADHNVIRYSTATKELLILNWYRYNWTGSEKLNNPLLDAIRAVKCDRFREYLADRYNDREGVATPYEHEMERRKPATVPPMDPATPSSEQDYSAIPEKRVRHKYGQYGWVRLTDEEYARLQADLGVPELERCIAYVDESAQSNGNKNRWRDWNLVLRRCHRDGWGLERRTARSASRGAMEDLQELHRQFAAEEGSA